MTAIRVISHGRRPLNQRTSRTRVNLRRAAAASLSATLLTTAGCAATEPAGVPSRSTEDRSVGHIHGLGIDPADDTLYVATHHGLLHIDGSTNARRVADRWQDTMAFTVAGPGHFLASGHPDLREDLPVHLGLIESTDAGETWSPRALQGEADFHVLEPVGDVLYAYDATTARLMRTDDRRNFTEIRRGPLISVAALDERLPLIATTDQGQLLSIDASSGQDRELGGPTLTYLDSASDGLIAGIAPNGEVHISSDTGKTWRKAGAIDGAPAAFTISPQGWYAATESAVFHSEDRGQSWSRVDLGTTDG